MDSFEVERKETLTRHEVATRLRRIATLLGSDDEEIAFERSGTTFKITIPETVHFKVELELGDDNELELEVTW
jgi:amphi-Trp domain-containing protein